MNPYKPDRLFALLLIAVLGLCWLAPARAAGSGMLIHLDGPIGPALSEHVTRNLQLAAERGLPLVVLRIDTPGGLDASMRDIVQAVLNSSVPVVGYVGPSGARAASAGTYILYATHVAAMAPATNLGAATPIPIGGKPQVPRMPAGEPGEEEPAAAAEPADAAGRKAVNDAVAYLRSLAEQRGRNADWAEQAVREGASLSAERALEQGVIDLIAEDLTALLAGIDGRSVRVGTREVELTTQGLVLDSVEQDWRTKLLAIVTNPSVAYILLMIGIYGLILEGYSPGSLVPGVIGAICLLLALFAFQLLPVNYTGLALIILGIVLMIAESLVPSFGVLGFGGVAAFVFGSVLLMDTDVPGYQLPLALVAGIALAGVATVGATIWLLLNSRKQPVVTGSEAIVGAVGEALEDFTDSGLVHVLGENWTARCPGPVHKGQRLRVTARDGLVIQVSPLPEQSSGGN